MTILKIVALLTLVPNLIFVRKAHECSKKRKIKKLVTNLIISTILTSLLMVIYIIITLMNVVAGGNILLNVLVLVLVSIYLFAQVMALSIATDKKIRAMEENNENRWEHRSRLISTPFYFVN